MVSDGLGTVLIFLGGNVYSFGSPFGWLVCFVVVFVS